MDHVYFLLSALFFSFSSFFACLLAFVACVRCLRSLLAFVACVRCLRSLLAFVACFLRCLLRCFLRCLLRCLLPSLLASFVACFRCLLPSLLDIATASTSHHRSPSASASASRSPNARPSPSASAIALARRSPSRSPSASSSAIAIARPSPSPSASPSPSPSPSSSPSPSPSSLVTSLHFAVTSLHFAVTSLHFACYVASLRLLLRFTSLAISECRQILPKQILLPMQQHNFVGSAEAPSAKCQAHSGSRLSENRSYCHPYAGATCRAEHFGLRMSMVHSASSTSPPTGLRSALFLSHQIFSGRAMTVAKIPVSVFLRVESKGAQIFGVTICSWRVSKTASKGPSRKSAFCKHQVPPLNQKKTVEMVRSASVSSGGGVARGLGRSVAGLVAG